MKRFLIPLTLFFLGLAPPLFIPNCQAEEPEAFGEDEEDEDEEEGEGEEEESQEKIQEGGEDSSVEKSKWKDTQDEPTESNQESNSSE